MKVEDILYDSWRVFKENWVSYLIATGIVGICSILTFFIAGPPLFFGLYYMAFKGLNGEDVEIEDVFKGFNYFITSWIYLIIAVILVGFGFLLLIYPGLILLALIQYAVPLIIVKEMGATDGIQKSISLGRENFKFTILLALTVFFLNTLGGIAHIGWIFVFPFIALCLTKAAIDLTNEQE